MKKIFSLVTLFIMMNSYGQAPVVYINFLSHNEDASSWSNDAYYLNNRAKLITLTNYFQSKGATFNLQSDYTYLNAVISKETGTILTTTNNKNILRWMYEDMGVEMDPHSHENVYIYPDIVKLMDSIGLPESEVMGGTLYNQPNGINTWTALINGQNGVIFPSKFWQPTYMMGGGTPQHTADINAYGFWNPQSMSNYLTHDPSQTLEHFGVGCDIKIKDTSTVAVLINKVRTLINRVATNQYPQSGFYYQTIFFGHGDLNNTTVYNKIIEVTDSLAAIVATGKAQWKTMEQGYTLWETVYGAQPFQWLCDQINGISEHELETTYILAPNPNSGSFELRIDKELEKAEIVVINSLGQIVHSQIPVRGKNNIELVAAPKGLYYCILKERGQILATRKIAIE